MNKILIFFCCASAILLFTIINLNIGPIISKKVGYDNVPDFDPDSSSGSTISFYWGNENCDLQSERKKSLSKKNVNAKKNYNIRENQNSINNELNKSSMNIRNNRINNEG